MIKKSLFNMTFLLLVGLLTNECCLRSAFIYDNINVGKIWKEDTCGINGNRLKITPVILKHTKEIIGRSSREITKIFGPPDFVQEFKLLHPNTTVFIYSTSSVERINGKCGDPVLRSFGFFIDNKTDKVMDIKEFVS